MSLSRVLVLTGLAGIHFYCSLNSKDAVLWLRATTLFSVHPASHLQIVLSDPSQM